MGLSSSKLGPIGVADSGLGAAELHGGRGRIETAAVRRARVHDGEGLGHFNDHQSVNGSLMKHQ